MKQNPASLIQCKTTTPSLLAAIALLFACFWSLPTVRAVSPAPDGGYAGGNTAEGHYALLSLTTAAYNTAVGYLSLGSVTERGGNTGIGAGALLANTGSENTATGFLALLINTTGFENTANGALALNSNTAGNDNTAIGQSALPSNTTGSFNTAIGYFALLDNVTGDNNTAIGVDAGDLITGSGNVCIGTEVGGAAGVNDTTWIKNVYDSVANGRAVYVNADNKIGTLSSSRRYKDEIKPMAQASEPVLSLKPVTFRYKKEVDPTRALSFGLVAEEVAQIDPGLVTLDRDGKPQTVRYEAVNAMLLNEFLKEHCKVQEEEAAIVQLKKDFVTTIAQLTARLDKQASQIQKVSAELAAASPSPDRLRLNKAAAQIVLNDQ